MNDNILQNGYPSWEELKKFNRIPSDERFAKGPVAVIECIQAIPCNPCEGACKFGAICVGEPIINLPQLEEEKCTGCGMCVAQCSGLAIFVVDKTYSETQATVSFPHEYLPLPEKGQTVTAVNRAGKPVCEAVVVRVVNPERNDHTPVVTVAIPKEFADVVRGMVRLGMEKPADHSCCKDYVYKENDPDDLIVCRCEEVTVGDIRKAIAEGAASITGVKRRTRAGMGLCQGRTCSKIVTKMLSDATGKRGIDIPLDTARPPMKPVTMKILGGDDDV
ncbi:(2Fe-2S)-binding protein [Clostridium sp. KNHs216]|uniref:(2Fe-2S)-binding protein n=1 Tax=Clostridium sp. KNHs216 TaxID=1550235 RepID=UPI00114E7F42|nr:(2Fe-2S)-binding protein [Clostridium sp. KNHs216]TQI66982.1 NAD(P)H-nitrite reductase large subunit [Clostridium sp. KNHs216]